MRFILNSVTSSMQWIYRQRLKILFFGSLFLLLFPVFFFRIRTNDFWTALYSGHYLSLFHGIPHHSTFTFAPVREIPTYLDNPSFHPVHWETYNWLSYVTIYLLFSLGGIPLVQLFRLIFGFLIVALLHSLIRFKKNVFILALLVLFGHAIYLRLSLRNYMFSTLFVVLVFVIWERLRYRHQYNYTYLLPLIFIVWSNMHASYLVGLGAFAFILIGDFFDGYYRDFKVDKEVQTRGWFIFLWSLLVVVLVKPIPDYLWLNFAGKFVGKGLNWSMEAFSFSGTSLKGLDITTAKLFSPSNIEWILSFHSNLLLSDRVTGISGYAHPIDYLNLMYVQASLLYLPLAFVLFIFLTKSIRLSNAFLVVFILIAATGRLRTLAFVPLVVTPIILIKYKQGEFKHAGRISSVLNKGTFVSILFFLIFSLMHLFQGEYHEVINIHAHNVGFGKWEKFDDTMPEKILDKYPNDRFFNNFGIGGFLIWNWWPAKKVYFDPKWVPYRVDFVRNRMTMLKSLNVDHAIVSLDVRGYHRSFLRSPDWEILSKNSVMISYVRSESKRPLDFPQ